MFDWKQCIQVYNTVKETTNFTKMFCYDCVITSTKNWLEEELTEEELKQRAMVVYDYYLDTDIQISKISDIICKYWKEYEKDEDFNIYDYMERLESEE